MQLDLSALSTDQIRGGLTKLGMSTAGTRAELVKRLQTRLGAVDHSDEGEAAAASDNRRSRDEAGSSAAPKRPTRSRKA